MRIVPPATTVTPAPSPNAAIASSREVGTTTSAASRVGAVTWLASGRLRETSAGAVDDAGGFCHRARRRRKTLRAWRGHFADIVRNMAFASIDELESALRRASYLPERGLSTALFISLTLE